MKLDMTPVLNKRVSALDFDFTLTPETVEGACDISDEIELTSPIRVLGKITDINGYMTLDAKVSVSYETVCDRCLAPLSDELDFDFKRTVAMNAANLDEDECDDIIWIKEGKIDFDADVIEELSLELPIYHLCSEDCPGLCSVCGKKLDGACKCSEKKEIDPRLEIFKKLLENSEK